MPKRKGRSGRGKTGGDMRNLGRRWYRRRRRRGSPQQCSRRGQCTGGQRTTVGRQTGPTLSQHTDIIYNTVDDEFLQTHPFSGRLKVSQKVFQPKFGKACPSLNSSFHLAAAGAGGRGDTCFQQLDCPPQDPTNRPRLIQIQMQIHAQIQMQIHVQIQMQIHIQIQMKRLVFVYRCKYRCSL